MTKSDAQALATSATVTLTYDETAGGSAGVVDLANDRLMVTRAGVYAFSAGLGFAGTNTTGYRAALLYRHNSVTNGEDLVGSSYVSPFTAGPTVLFTTAAKLTQCVVGDWFYVRVVHNAGVASSTHNANANQWAQLNWVRP